KEPHVIRITPPMRVIIEQVPRRVGTDYLFGKKGFSSWSIGKPLLDEAIKIGAWKVHDIRRSVATGMGNLGTPPHVVECVLGHVAPGIVGVYNWSRYWPELCTAFETWSTHVADLVDWKPAEESVPV